LRAVPAFSFLWLRLFSALNGIQIRFLPRCWKHQIRFTRAVAAVKTMSPCPLPDPIGQPHARCPQPHIYQAKNPCAGNFCLYYSGIYSITLNSQPAMFVISPLPISWTRHPCVGAKPLL